MSEIIHILAYIVLGFLALLLTSVIVALLVSVASHAYYREKHHHLEEMLKIGTKENNDELER